MWPWTDRGRTTDRPKPPSLSRPGRKAAVYLCRRISVPAEEARKRRAARKRCRRSGAPDGCPIQHRNAAARCPAVLITERYRAPCYLSAMKLLADFVRRDAATRPHLVGKGAPCEAIRTGRRDKSYLPRAGRSEDAKRRRGGASSGGTRPTRLKFASAHSRHPPLSGRDEERPGHDKRVTAAVRGAARCGRAASPPRRRHPPRTLRDGRSPARSVCSRP
jgi:hypothetical protein